MGSPCRPVIIVLTALESYLESVKIQLAEIKPSKTKNNLSRNEQKALTELKNNTEIVIKKADKGTTTVIMNKCDKMCEAQTQLNNREHYKPLEEPMILTTQRVNELVTQLYKITSLMTWLENGFLERAILQEYQHSIP